MAQLNLGIVAQNETLTLEVESTIKQDIRKGQLNDEKIVEYKKLVKMGKVPELEKMNKELCGSRIEFVYLRLKSCEKLYLSKHMIQLILFILEVLRYINI
jgi:hypothetical protein